MLAQIRHEYIDNATLSLPIHIILTGRPSPDLTQSGFLRDKTPLLTIRPLTPDQLRSFIQNLSSIVKAHPLQLEEEDVWPDFEPDKFAPVIERDEEEFARLQDGQSRSDRSEMMQTGSLGALGLPLLAQLAARLISVKAWHLSAFAFVLVLLAATAYLALAPTPALAAFGSARCSDGSIVICNAFRCVCQDMQGCTGYDSAGGVVPEQSKYCPGVAGPGY